jgi:hypothetical protein
MRHSGSALVEEPGHRNLSAGADRLKKVVLLGTSPRRSWHKNVVPPEPGREGDMHSRAGKPAQPTLGAAARKAQSSPPYPMGCAAESDGTTNGTTQRSSMESTILAYWEPMSSFPMGWRRSPSRAPLLARFAWVGSTESLRTCPKCGWIGTFVQFL